MVPNRARNDVRLALALAEAVSVCITVYDLAGHEVARPIADEWLSGRVTRTWQPKGLPSGIYYVRAKLGNQDVVRKMVLLGHDR